MRWVRFALLFTLAFGLSGCGNTSPSDIAVGYNFTSTIPMKTVRVQKPLKGGQSKFELLVQGRTFPLEAGKPFFFTTAGFADGVDAFTIRGIHASERLDANNPNAFPTGLSFMKEGQTGAQVTMDPIRYKPSILTSPWVLGSLAALLVGGLCCAGFVWWKKQNAI